MMSHTTLFPIFDNSVLGIVSEAGKMDELHLYHGSRCNRACAFCCVHGEPQGHHEPFHAEVLQAAVNLVAQKGSLKVYGGEPTLDAENLMWSVSYLREQGFIGAITVFSNGLRPRVLLNLLQSDPDTRVVLNYAIATGTGEKPLPAATLAALQAYHREHPARIFLSHDFAVPVGRQAGVDSDVPQSCYRCYPTLTSTGNFHACPFTVESSLPHYALGGIAETPTVIQERFSQFLCWIEEELEPEARRKGVSSCVTCTAFRTL